MLFTVTCLSRFASMYIEALFVSRFKETEIWCHFPEVMIELDEIVLLSVPSFSETLTRLPEEMSSE